jgi:hypothetical protein
MSHANCLTRLKGPDITSSKVRTTLGFKPGDRVGFIELEKGTFFLVAMNVPLRQLRGRVGGNAAGFS